MFFSTDLLSKRNKSGFGLYWLAATVGVHTKSSLSKLSRRLLLGANLPEACSILVDPPEPLALRLTSSLLLGIVRVYSQISMKLHTSRAGSFRAESSNTLESHLDENKRNRLDAISINRRRDNTNRLNVMHYNNEFEEIFEFNDLDPLVFYNDQFDSFLGPAFSSSGIGITSIIQAPEERKRKFTSKPSEINLDENLFDKLSNDSIHGDINNLDFHQLSKENLNIQEFGDDERIELDLGILGEDLAGIEGYKAYFHQPSSIAESRVRVDSEIGRGEVGRKREDSGLPLRLASVDIELARGREDDHGGARVPGSGEFDYEPTSRFDVPMLQLEHQPENNLDDQEPLTENRASKIITPLVDPITTLTSEQLEIMRRGYPMNLLKRVRVDEKKRLKKMNDERAKELVYGVPDFFQAKDLIVLWDKFVNIPKVNLIEEEDLLIEKRLRHQSTFSRGEDTSGVMDLENRVELNEDHNQVLPWMMMGTEEEVPERIVEIEEEVMGRQRLASAEMGTPVHDRGLAPWNITSSMAPGSDAERNRYSVDSALRQRRDFGGYESSIGRSGSKIMGETPVKMRYKRPSSMISSSHDPQIQLGTFGTPTDRLKRARLSSPSQENDLGERMGDRKNLESKDSKKFLEWTKNQVNDPSDFLFSDIVPVINTRTEISCKAFIKVLELTGLGLIKVLEQDEPYGEVEC
ncbi:expressed protein [Phakopsora pachyrhizi]|uniref:Expressed protein n=1 Tax=Phakopsora pachyrhizi TaxID=170000 RepID=A0AAV0BIK2_PHAPC|nr:expressed protein [Phakopsora pachyrhizi]